MPSYLDEEEEALPPVDEAAETDDERKQRLQKLLGTRSLYGSVPPFNPAEPPIPGRAPAPPEIDLPEAVPAGPGTAPVVQDRNRTADDLARVIGGKPDAPKPKWWQRLAAGAVGAAAGYTNAAGRTKIDAAPAVEGILGGTGYKAKLSDWQNRVGGAQARADAAKGKEEGWWKNRQLQRQEDASDAQAEHSRAQTGLVKQQAATLAEEGKRSPKGNYLTAGGGLFNAETGEWVKQPVEKTGMVEIDAERGEGLGVKPLADGKYYLPKEAMSQYVGTQMKPPPPPKDIDHVKLAIMAAGGDPNNPATITPEVAKKATQILKPPNAGSTGVQLTPEALDYWAKFAGTTGQTPPLGMGASNNSVRQAILNRAPEVAGGSVAGNRAVNRADAGSLANIQKMRDAVVSFENTALANLDLFVQQAKPIIDSGSQLINAPLRTIDRRALGSAELAAYDAARRIAINEVAKVTSNPTLSGQLSDSARHEVEGLIPEEATLKQIYHVVGVLKQDMANRHKFLDQSLGEIRGRISGPQAPAGGKVKLRAPDGSISEVSADQVEHYVNLGATRVN